MKKIFICFIVLIASFVCNEIYAQSTYEFQQIIADSQFVSVNDKFHAILNQHPLLAEKKDVVAGAIKIRQTENRTGTFFIALILLFLFAGIKNAFFKHFSNLFRVFTTFNISKRQMKEQLENNTRASALFLVLFFCCVSFLLYLLLKDEPIFPTRYSAFIKYLICFAITFCFYFLKTGFSRMLAWVFGKETVFHEYQFTNSMINEFAGLFLFPLSIFLLVTKGKLFLALLVFSILLLIAMNLFKYVRLMGLMKKMLRIDFLHFFLYLCAFEIMPLLVLIKLAR